MKFSANPQAIAAASEIPDNPSENYLREAVSHTMNNDQDTIFDFMVQVRSDKGDLEVENASALWNEEDFPFIKVATITIAAPQQEISQPRNLEHCENQTFTPWHSLTAHQPIGSINRLRKPVYQASADHRLAEPEVEMPFFIQLMQRFFRSIFS